MTAHRRLLFAFALAAACLLPACLHVTAPIAPPEVQAKLATEKPAAKTDFGLFTAKPGTVIPTKSAAKDMVAQKPVPTTPEKSGDAVRPIGEPGSLPLPFITSPPGPLPEPPLVAVAREFAAGRPERAIEHIKSLPRANQDIVLTLFPLVVTGSAADLTGDQTGTAVLVEQLRATMDRLAPYAALAVEPVVLCRSVSGFGRYDPWPTGHPYRPSDLAQLYLEVRNLASVPTTGPGGEKYLTHTEAIVRIWDAHGKLVDQPHPEDVRRRVREMKFDKKQFTHTPVHDFHGVYAFPVPSMPGVYTVTVELRDPGSRRVVKTAPIRFDVSGP